MEGQCPCRAPWDQAPTQRGSPRQTAKGRHHSQHGAQAARFRPADPFSGHAVPERRAAFNSLDTTNCKTSSQESIDTKLNNLRLRIEQNEHRRSDPSQAYSEDNIFNGLGSVTKLAKRSKTKELRKNIPDNGRKALDSFTCNTPTMDEEKKEAEDEDEELEKEDNTSLTNLPLFVESPNKQNGFMPLPPQTKEEENETKLEDKEFHLQMEP